MKKDVACDIVAYAAGGKFSDLPKSTVKIAKKFIFDTIGVAIAGSAAPGCKEVVSYVKDVGGKPESTIMMFGGKGPNERDYRRGASIKFEKGIGAKYLELKICDRARKAQPEFEIRDWE